MEILHLHSLASHKKINEFSISAKNLQLLSTFLDQNPEVHEVFKKIGPQISLIPEISALLIPSKILPCQVERI